MNSITPILLALLNISSVHAAEVYRCATAEGLTRYQQEPCPGRRVVIETQPTGIGGLRDTEVHAYLDAIEQDISRIGPNQMQQLDTVMSHVRLLRQIVD